MLPFLSRLVPNSSQRTSHRRVNHFEAVLGTRLDLEILASSAGVASRAESVLLEEIDRGEAIFSRFLPDSELNRFLCSSGFLEVSDELRAALKASQGWTERSGGAFHPGAEALSALWTRAARDGCPPNESSVREVLEALRAPPWEWSEDGLRARRVADVPMNFNAFAKGLIADRACLEAARLEGVVSVLVNLGGDLRHAGRESVTVALETPGATADNLEPLLRIPIRDAAVASSGGARRGFRVGEQWYSHVIDPRSGQPVTHTTMVTVVAPDAGSADVLATIFSVLEPSHSLALADELPGVACLLFTPEGHFRVNRLWRESFAIPGGSS